MTASGTLKNTGLGLAILLTGLLIPGLLTSCNLSGTSDRQNQDTTQTTPKDSVKALTDLNNIALFLAGMQPAGKSGPFPQISSAEWKTYARESDTNWKHFGNRKLIPVQKWRNREMAKSVDTVKTLFYPFSGPDFIFANAFFPDAGTYILFGLEPPGKVPDPRQWKDKDLKPAFNNLRKSIDDVTALGFFRTVDMKVDLETASIEGVTPILMLFLARSGNRIDTILPGVIAPEGVFKPLGAFQNFQGEKAYGTAVEIRFTQTTTGKHKSLVYFSVDISDKGLAKQTGCENLLKQIPQGCLTLIKSASYLMHLGGFSTIRKTILGKSELILQDDSGIPYRFFKESAWDVKLYGTYSKTIDLFKHKYQEDLKQAYDALEKPAPVPFRIGYNIKFHETNLLMAVRKKK